MFRLVIILALVFQGACSFGQTSNALLSRAYWKSHPTLEQVQTEIALGNDPAGFDAHKFNPITWAILEDAPMEVVLFLLKQEGNDVNLRAHDGRSPIFWAAYRGNIELMSKLIQEGAKLDLIDDHGMSVVNFAANTGQTNTALYDLCVKNGIDLSREKTTDGATPLLLVIPYLDAPEDIDYFVKNGLKLEQTDEEGNNAFVYASITGNQKILKFLKDKGFDTKANNDAAMLFACKGTRSKSNTTSTFLFLEEMGVSPLAVDKDQRNALHYLASKSKDKDVFEYFFKKGLTIDRKDANGNTAFLSAVESNSVEVIRFLLEKKPDVSITNSNGENALHIAVKRGNNDIVNAIIAAKVDLNQTTNEGLTPLHVAAMTAKSGEVLKLLVEAGADKSILTTFEESAYDLSLENELIKGDNTSLNFLKP